MASAQHNFILDATAPPNGGNTQTVYPFPMADAPFVGTVDYQEDTLSFTPNDVYAVSSPSLGSQPLSALLDGTAPLLATIDNTLDLPYGDDAHKVYPFPVTDAPSAGVVHYHAQEDPLSFTPNDVYAVSSSLGYSSLPALLDATAPLPESLEDRLDPPCGGDTRSVYPFPVANAPSAGAR